ncbi:MAG: hypothetical protein KBG48_24295 [Kofleriaceae bacterium]|nr:hypothetical protein [Kofleriaceae bacterium]MBP9170548.1 hypothetical protein [Kofleriaceae bacterium]MBP9860984.1 hypothetical protein [Kofleriaceae bacterium]
MADHLREGAVVTAPQVRRFALAIVAATAAGCLPEADGDDARVECEATDQCNAAAGEVCDQGVCWGDPPPGRWSAIVSPPAELRGSWAKTALADLTIGPDGTLADGALRLDAAIRLRGEITIPCPAVLPGCTGRRGLPGQVRLWRPAGFAGGPRLVETVEADADGRFQVAVARPASDQPLTYTVSFTPALTGLGVGLPSPAELLAPVSRDVVLDLADRDPVSGDLPLTLALDPAAQREVPGRLVSPDGETAGWRITAEVVTNTNLGSRQVISTTATTAETGDFALRIPPEIALVDLVARPPTAIDAELRPVVVVRDLIVGERIPDLSVPALGNRTTTRFVVRGVDSSGGEVGVDGAAVVVRLDYPLGGGRALAFEVRTTTVGDRAELPLFARAGGSLLSYSVDVIPPAGSEFAARYDVPLVVGTGALEIDLDRRRRVSGKLRDADGEPVVGAALTATVSAASMCALSSQAARLALGQAPAQTTTTNRGEFALYVDGQLGDVALAYDLVTRPSDGDPHPEWTFTETDARDAESLDLRLPDAARVRGEVRGGEAAIAEATVTIYERLDVIATCGAGLDDEGVAIARGRGVSGADGWVGLVLPRP